MRSKATRYRELADAASDAEAAESLRHVAGDIEVIIPVLEDRVPEVSSASIWSV